MRRFLLLILGLVSILPIVYVLGFITFFVAVVFGPGDRVFDEFGTALFVCHVTVMLLFLSLGGYYVYDVWNNPTILPDKKTQWLLLILLFAFLGLPAYWYVHKWKVTASESASPLASTH